MFLPHLFYRIIKYILSAQFKSEDFKYWSAHELLFHINTRLGFNTSNKYGSYHFLHKTKPLPAYKRISQKNTIKLYKPSLKSIKKNDLSFTTILEKRASVRYFSKGLLTLKQLAEFLYRSARIKKIYKKNLCEELSKRPYPAGGGCYELEIYLVVRSCSGLKSGLYYYHPYYHTLKLISKNYYESLLDDAVQATGGDRPPILFCLTMKKKKISWKYENIGYALALKHTGILLYHMQLIATAMNLGSCILGCGNSVTFAKASKLNFLNETTVGELILGPT